MMSNMLPVYDLSTREGEAAFDARLARLRETTSQRTEAAAAVAQIIEDVRCEGDGAVVRYMRRWTDPRFTADRIRVGPDEIAAASRSLDGELKAAIAGAVDHVRAYQDHLKPKDPGPVLVDGAELGLRFTPVPSVAMTVPGGTAVLFSTLIMLAVPALAAGVSPARIAILNPPPTRTGDEAAGDVSPVVLATCAVLGIQTVYRIGGAQAVAAVAYGTDRVDRVEMVAGPGNVYVQLAQSQLSGVIGTDGGFYGPSEILTIADETGDPSCVAADLIAQAEHDPGKCFLVAWSGEVVERIQAEIRAQLPRRRRRDAIESALRAESCAVLVGDAGHAVDVANTVACEHVSLAVADADALAAGIHHAGEIFLGDRTAVAAGDYYAGPSHCLPTGTTARFASGISVYTFLKRTGTVCYRRGMNDRTVDAIAAMAEAEGLDGHAESVRMRERGK